MNTFSKALAAIAVLAVCGAGGAAIAANHTPFAGLQQKVSTGQTAQLQSVSGRITSVAGNTFTIETSQDSSQKNGPKQITFTIDQQTVVEGKITIGSTADVTFRSEDNNNIAVSVRVSAT